jgi:hypothetical protein
VRVANHVFEPLTSRLGYVTFRREAEVITRGAGGRRVSLPDGGRRGAASGVGGGRGRRPRRPHPSRARLPL